MAEQQEEPDLLEGVALDTIPDGGLLAGKIGDLKGLLIRSGDTVHAVGGTCTHLGAPLAEGLVAAGEIRCPWHHACFDIATGEASKAPAFDPLPTWPVVIEKGRVRVATREPHTPAVRNAVAAAGPFVVIGGGAAGYAAALALKTAAPGATCTLVSEDEHAPYDRTLLTKDYLDGKFGEDHLSISRQDLAALGIDVRLSTAATKIDRSAQQVVLASGDQLAYDKLLIATGAEPKRPDIPGIGKDHVTTLQSLADCRRILARIGSARQVVVLGSSFIGLEAAASLVSRGVAVTVISTAYDPLAKPFGSALAAAVLETHRRNGTRFVFGQGISAIEDKEVQLDDGTRLNADLVIVGVGVTPRTKLAEDAGLDIGNGVTVDRYLRTSDPNIHAAGDIACWPDPHSGQSLRVEHWVVAQRQGQVAAANMLGQTLPYDDVPFFWTKHFDLSIRYIGHAGKHPTIGIDGTPAAKDATVTFSQDGRVEAIATMERDWELLQREVLLEQSLEGRPSTWLA